MVGWLVLGARQHRSARKPFRKLREGILATGIWGIEGISRFPPSVSGRARGLLSETMIMAYFSLAP